MKAHTDNIEIIHGNEWKRTQHLLKLYVIINESAHSAYWNHTWEVLKLCMDNIETIHGNKWKRTQTILKLYMAMNESAHSAYWNRTWEVLKLHMDTIEITRGKYWKRTLHVMKAYWIIWNHTELYEILLASNEIAIYLQFQWTQELPLQFQFLFLRQLSCRVCWVLPQLFYIEW